MKQHDERALVFHCNGHELLGIVAVPHRMPALAMGVVVVVGGPQYRVGSHRQFTLLCRHLADQGIPSLRFDYHGLGDSDGPPALGVDGVEDDVRAAIDAFMKAVPGVKGVVLWGLCGAASACALYAPADARVQGLVMLNPWVRTEEGLAKARLRHYYLGRLGDREFWGRIARGDVALGAALKSFGGSVAKAAGWGGGARQQQPDANSTASPLGALPDRILASLVRTRLPALVILSGEADLTANEFRQLTNNSTAWRQWMKSTGVECQEIEGSNHTFSRTDWRDRVAELTTRFVQRR